MRNVAAWKTICLNTFSVLFPSFVLLLPKREDEIQTLTLFSAVFVPNVAADSVSLRIVPILPIHMCTLLPQCSSTCERICQLLILQHHTCGQDRVSLTVDRGTARKTYGPQGMEADGCAYERTNLVRAVQGPMHCPFDISSGSTQGLLIFFLAS